MNSIYHHDIVFGLTYDRAMLKLEEIYANILLDKEEIVEGRTRDTIKTNMRTIRAVRCSENVRGYRCSHVYVDADLSVRQFLLLILPVIRHSEDSPYNHVTYYNI